ARYTGRAPLTGPDGPVVASAIRGAAGPPPPALPAAVLGPPASTPPPSTDGVPPPRGTRRRLPRPPPRPVPRSPGGRGGGRARSTPPWPASTIPILAAPRRAASRCSPAGPPHPGLR